ncbi:GLPGLI family protein [Flavobacterium sp.]|uniref:GLPGLI family protein n=1 Tax=Flavobacterium sp. TaxID=239 RepID=UPI003526E6E1
MKLIIVFLLSGFCFSQTGTTFIEYGVKAIPKESNLEKMSLEVCPNLYDIVEGITFNLYANDTISLFEIEDKFKEDNSTETGIAKLRSGYNGEIITKNDSIYNLNFANYLERNLILKKEIKHDWNITNESKIINDLLCYKAILKKETVNSKGTFVNTIIAWFSPEINLPYGPLGFSKLPGLILEAQTKDCIYGVKKIEFNYKSEIKFPKIDTNKFLEEEEFEKKINDYREELKK